MNQEERRIHIQIADWLRQVGPECLWFHIPNGGNRNAWTGALLKRMGVKAGVSDFIFLAGGKAYFMEVKAPGGRLSRAQRIFLEECENHSLPWALVMSIDDVRQALADWGIRAWESDT